MMAMKGGLGKVLGTSGLASVTLVIFTHIPHTWPLW
jgi:hypothetical protein